MSFTLSSLIIFTIFCLSVYACMARPIPFASTKEVSDKGQLSNMVSTQEVGGEVVHSSSKQALKDLHKESLGNNMRDANSGIQNVISSSNVGLLKTIKVKGSRRQARSILGFESHVMEEATGSKQKSTRKDVSVTDYDPPHRKPPIHNRRC